MVKQDSSPDQTTNDPARIYGPDFRTEFSSRSLLLTKKGQPFEPPPSSLLLPTFQFVRIFCPRFYQEKRHHYHLLFCAKVFEKSNNTKPELNNQLYFASKVIIEVTLKKNSRETFDYYYHSIIYPSIIHLDTAFKKMKNTKSM